MRFFVIINLLFSLFLAGCSEPVPPQASKEEKERDLVILTRSGINTYFEAGDEEVSGFDYDLVRMLAQELQVNVRFVLAKSDADILRGLMNGEGHMAAAWQVRVEEPDLRRSIPYFESRNVLVTHEASLPITSLSQLPGKTVHVVAGSRQESALREATKKIPNVRIVAKSGISEMDLLEGVEKRRYDAAVVNNAVFSIGNNFFPELQDSLGIGSTQPIVWLFAPGADPDLVTQANAFIDRIQQNGELARLKDKYFGHVDRLTQEDILQFVERIGSLLPQYRPFFQSAQSQTAIDWRLLAALAYQESQWDPLATSPTGVRGMMMLTGDTADALGVRNRLDAEQSIRAGALYLKDLRDALPATVREPDRTWLALAAYNVGMGHCNAARQLAKSMKVDPDSWYAMKKVLPLLAKREIYTRLKSGKGRGGEAVIMTENIRVYYDILKRHERPYRGFSPTLPRSDATPVKPRAATATVKRHKQRATADKPAAQRPRRKEA